VNPTRVNRIAVNTGGGDAPGLNAVIRAVVRAAEPLGWKVFGIERGYDGIISGKGIRHLTRAHVRGILNQGGSILGTNNRGNPFQYPVTARGKTVTRDITDSVIRHFHRLGIDALVAIGGDGSLTIAAGLWKKGFPVVGVPKTIDNDLVGTVVTFGFDTAVSTATEALDKLHSTAASHERVMAVEVMGRYAGWIALHSGIAGGADVILIPEIPFTIESVCRAVQARYRSGRNFCIIVAAEGAKPKGGTYYTQGPKEPGKEHVRLGGIAEALAKEIQAKTKRESRSLVLGHLLRGGSPTTFDRLLATRFGAAAVRFIQEGRFGYFTALDPPSIVPFPIAEIVGKQKTVPVDGDVVTAARAMGICFGDE
jgi:phosphofructokinase-like protein